jgi:hypothetical protein
MRAWRRFRFGVIQSAHDHGDESEADGNPLRRAVVPAVSTIPYGRNVAVADFHAVSRLDPVCS